MTDAEFLENAEVADLIQRALSEDVGRGDATSESLIAEDEHTTAVILSRGDYVVAGGLVARQVFLTVDHGLDVTLLRADGEGVHTDDEILRVCGRARSILTAERTALNFMQRMTGIATLAHRFVEEVAGCDAVILDTRKTTPTLRALEKYAVCCGGGENHRMGLYDRVMIKDNHRGLWARAGGGDLAAAVRRAREKFPGLAVEVEVENLADLKAVITESPEWVLLDNMEPEAMRECVGVCTGVSKVEASGGITLENVREVAESGVDAISLGCLTHSVPAADLSLELQGV